MVKALSTVSLLHCPALPQLSSRTLLGHSLPPRPREWGDGGDAASVRTRTPSLSMTELEGGGPQLWSHEEAEGVSRTTFTTGGTHPSM